MATEARQRANREQPTGTGLTFTAAESTIAWSRTMYGHKPSLQRVLKRSTAYSDEARPYRPSSLEERQKSNRRRVGA